MNVLLSAGPTLEPIDAVRFISNRSSGKMGVALSEASVAAGHDTVLVHGPLQVALPKGSRIFAVERASEMKERLAQHMDWADVLIMSAAVCDMRPDQGNDHKVDKGELEQLSLVPNPDIVGSLARDFPNVHIVSFSLENDFDPQRPLKKMRAKKSHWVVYNQLRSMGADASRFGVIDRDGREVLGAAELDKKQFAQRLIGALASLS
jgi:phosphopantothenoylcysteine decarboxylase/phosphopantothenate--cysteine ligase